MESTANQQPVKPSYNTAHLYIAKLQRKWFGGKSYGPSMLKLISQAPLPDQTEQAIDASLAILDEAKIKAPNASAKTRRRWLKAMSHKLVSAGHAPPA